MAGTLGAAVRVAGAAGEAAGTAGLAVRVAGAAVGVHAGVPAGSV
ncbi:hypothetical protein ACFY2Q_02695 [Micromonospora sp. NPDC000316]